jgi:hypothetical protein
MWIALAFFTGMREGEVCGIRWRDWDPSSTPLGALTVQGQYDRQPLKTDRPRIVPVHPALAWMLERWRATGFELIHCRRPRPDDPIVPNRAGETHSKSSAYKQWRRACEAVGVSNRSLHSTRHTFITTCRRGGARKDYLERVTHNAAGDIVDTYTRFEWDPLCEAVLCLTVDVAVDGVRKTLPNVVEAPGIEPGPSLPRASDSASIGDNDSVDEPPSFGAKRPGGSIRSARRFPNADERLRLPPGDPSATRELRGLAAGVAALELTAPDLDWDDAAAAAFPRLVDEARSRFRARSHAWLNRRAS